MRICETLMRHLSMLTYISQHGRVFINIFYICMPKQRFKFEISLLTFKATFSVQKPIPKNAQMITLYTNWSLYITFTMIYYIRQE